MLILPENVQHIPKIGILDPGRCDGGHQVQEGRESAGDLTQYGDQVKHTDQGRDQGRTKQADADMEPEGHQPVLDNDLFRQHQGLVSGDVGQHIGAQVLTDHGQPGQPYQPGFLSAHLIGDLVKGDRLQ